MYYVIDKTTNDETDWYAAPYWRIEPVAIEAGEHKGKYAVIASILGCDPIFEAYRELLESFPTATATELDGCFPPEPTE